MMNLYLVSEFLHYENIEWTKSNAQQNIEQLQTPTMGVTINKKLTATEPQT